MVGGRCRCLRCLFTYIVVLLSGVFFQAAEGSEETNVFHKKVGNSVTLSPNLSTVGVSRATWKYGDILVATQGPGVTANNPFSGRVEFSNADLSLTVRNLTLHDSGNFSFSSQVNDQQRPPVIITLQVHELTLISNTSELGSNGFCTVFLECKATPNNKIIYSWTVRNKTHEGPKLEKHISPEDGDITFNCTANSDDIKMSEFTSAGCHNDSESVSKGISHELWISIAAGGSLLVIVTIISVSLWLCRRKWSGSDSNELTVYADISDFSPEVGTSDSKLCSVYDTIEDKPDREMPKTIYDKIQIERIRKASVSHYQEVS